MPFKIVFDWGDRSRRLQVRLKNKVSGVSFWLTPSTCPVQLGQIAPGDVAQWDSAQVVPLGVIYNVNSQTATVGLPGGTQYVRLDFDLSATINGQTCNVLSFKQLFQAVLSQNGSDESAVAALLPTQYSFEDVVLTPSPNGPVKAKGDSTMGRRTFVGTHPLLTAAGAGKLIINAEFVDVTELWWLVHPDTLWGWYWNPDVKGRQENLRVLAWTGGGNPMIWFVAIPDAAITASSSAPDTKSAPTSADIVFFRPPPGVNSFIYTADEAGFADKNHDAITQIILARYLLNPIPEATFLALQQAGSVKSPELLADQVQPKSTGPISPSDPMRLMSLSYGNKSNNDAFTGMLPNAFRPVGLETAVNRTGSPHLLFLPLGFDATGSNPEGGYEAALLSGLKVSLASALFVLWNANAICRDQTVVPTATDRKLWVAAHSAGNNSLWTCLTPNASDIERIISFDSNTMDSGGLPSMAAAGKKRQSIGQTLDAFVITTPSTSGNANGLTAATDVALRKLRKTGALVTVLPDFSQRADYWHLQPAPITNPFILYLLAKWNVPSDSDPTKTFLDVSAKTPGNWNFLFFHELAVFGGELVQPSKTTSSTPAGASATPPYVRTFFEMALGQPQPRPPA